ncbi:MAG: GNAT family N-acetyltransferase [Pseudomonadota bacterium]|nr:GNAT family N-acetyltransferase [Pseudomonadota bacterium]
MTDTTRYYPEHLTQQFHLKDGQLATLRPIHPEDAEIEQDFVRHLSAQARHYRFMSYLNELPPSMLERFTHVDFTRDMGLIITVGTPPDETEIAMAQYSLRDDRTSCEFAVAVGDDYQGQGLGRRLMETMIRAAREHGLRHMFGLTLHDNESMKQLARELGFRIRIHLDEPRLVEMLLDLHPSNEGEFR